MKRSCWLLVAAILLLAASGVAFPVSGNEKTAATGGGRQTAPAAPANQEPPAVCEDCVCADCAGVEVERGLRELDEELQGLPAELPEIEAGLTDMDGMDAVIEQDPEDVADTAARVAKKVKGLQLGMGTGWADEGGWLGIDVNEVTQEKASELKLAAEGGVLVLEVVKESPASKAGIKVNDVITSYNGEKVKGAVQFHRLVRETPPGRTIQISVWRDGRSENLPVQISTRAEGMEKQFQVFGPHDFDFHFDFPKDLGDFPSAYSVLRPPLGIRALEINGQLAGYFAVPGGAGVLVEEVTEGSAAQKAGLKAGDVIVKVNGQEVQTTSELRSKLRGNREEKTATLGVIRQGKEITVSVEIERPRPPAPPRIARRATL